VFGLPIGNGVITDLDDSIQFKLALFANYAAVGGSERRSGTRLGCAASAQCFTDPNFESQIPV
jgi:hypothetical protein